VTSDSLDQGLSEYEVVECTVEDGKGRERSREPRFARMGVEHAIVVRKNRHVCRAKTQRGRVSIIVARGCYKGLSTYTLRGENER
jgi:hypothetical protein